MFSRTARGLLTESKTILMNYSCLALVLKSKPRLKPGDTRMVLRGYSSVSNPSLLYLWLNVLFYACSLLASLTMQPSRENAAWDRG